PPGGRRHAALDGRGHRGGASLRCLPRERLDPGLSPLGPVAAMSVDLPPAILDADDEHRRQAYDRMFSNPCAELLESYRPLRELLRDFTYRPGWLFFVED